MYTYRRVEPGGAIVTARVIVCLSNTRVDYFKTSVYSNRIDIVLHGGQGAVDDDSVKAITQGITEAVIKAVAPKP